MLHPAASLVAGSLVHYPAHVSADTTLTPSPGCTLRVEGVPVELAARLLAAQLPDRPIYHLGPEAAALVGLEPDAPPYMILDKVREEVPAT